MFKFKPGQVVPYAPTFGGRKCYEIYIYKITNRVSKKFYIGQARDIYARLAMHRTYGTVKEELGPDTEWRITILDVIKLPKDASKRQQRHYAPAHDSEQGFIKNARLKCPHLCVNKICRGVRREFTVHGRLRLSA